MSIKVEKINKIIDNKEIYIYSLSNENGLTARIMNYGGVILSLDIPDKNGDKRDVVLGFGDLDDYTTSTVYFGALVGRCANRIQEAVIEIGGKEYNLAKNDGNNHLHGGTLHTDAQCLPCQTESVPHRLITAGYQCIVRAIRLFSQQAIEY